MRDIHFYLLDSGIDLFQQLNRWTGRHKKVWNRLFLLGPSQVKGYAWGKQEMAEVSD